jgi:hypothetical protein
MFFPLFLLSLKSFPSSAGSVKSGALLPSFSIVPPYYLSELYPDIIELKEIDIFLF